MTTEIYDIGADREFDRFTVIINGQVFGMSENPLSPCGFNQYCGGLSELPFARQGKRVAFKNLPIDVRTAINERKSNVFHR